jgi:putative transcriptional regulator
METEVAKGTILVASPEIDVGILFRSVVIICEHTTNGSFGLMINKNIDIELPDEVLNSQEINNPNVAIRAGGPVQANQMMLLHNCTDIPQETLEICNNVYLGGNLQFLQKIVADPEGPHVNMCFGYIGWSNEQLQEELLEGHWFTHPGAAKYVFHTPPQNIWRTILQDMGGNFAAMSMIPEDLTLN